MKILAQTALWFTLLLLSQTVCKADTHKYWVCGVTTYQSVIGGKTQQGQCHANTAYSNPPCKEFFVEFEGAGGIRPDAPYEQNVGGATTKIEINQVNNQHTYSHIIIKADNQWIYRGKCQYFEAPASEKLYMDDGLKTQ